jgi:4-hydroxy-3-methylbut-2-en-1-yl diphosphate reductase
MRIEIDKNSGYCFGVEYAIQMAENELDKGETLYCLGDIVHNTMEVNRLASKGLKVISKEDLQDLQDCKVLIRAHGEPPETYQTALKNNIELIDASCPVVLKLQNRVKHEFDRIEAKGGQMIIYGQKGHAEVVGLNGQIHNKALVVTTEEELEGLDYGRPITLFSQTTKSTRGFQRIRNRIEEKIREATNEKDLADIFDANDSICRQVSNREPQLLVFAKEFEVILFVSGKKSSNGKALYSVCQSQNDRSYFIESEEELEPEWILHTGSVGICGATSTPMWLMEQVARKVAEIRGVEWVPHLA